MLTRCQCLTDASIGAPGAWAEKLPQCVKDESLRKKMSTCYEKKGAELLKPFVKMERETNGDWMPYVRVDGKVVGTIDEAIETEVLKRALCEAISQQRLPVEFYPNSCPQQKRVRVGDNIDTTDKVLVQMAWRAYCPACKWFLTSVIPILLAKPQ